MNKNKEQKSRALIKRFAHETLEDNYRRENTIVKYRSL